MEIKGKKVLVFGSGISGIAASRLLAAEGAEVILYDGNTELDKEKILADILEGSLAGNGQLETDRPKTDQPETAQLETDQPEGMKLSDLSGRVVVVLGEFPEEQTAKLSLAVMSPGVPTDLPAVETMRRAGVPIWGEIELAYVFGRGDVLAVTGTNGKTTTTALLGEIMKNYRESTFVVGNIGNPYTEIALETRDDTVIVAEMSSFQLETIHTFRPKVSAILNLTPDHLNRHHTMEAYIEAKENIARNQMAEDVCVLNYEDEVTRAFGETVAAEVLYFSSRRTLEKGIYLKDGEIIYQREEPVKICHVDELKLLGTHNYENVMAAAAMAAAYGVPMEIIRRTVKEFAGVAHGI